MFSAPFSQDEMLIRNMLSLDSYNSNSVPIPSTSPSSANANAFSMRLWRLAHVWSAYRNSVANSQNGLIPVSSSKDDSSLPSSPLSDSVIPPKVSRRGGPFTCDQCGLTFTRRDELEKHETSHPTPNQSCKICFKQFANVYRLQRHMISHDESAGLRKFKCPDCEKAFKFKHHLKEHVRIHSGEKPFECPNCGKRFSHSGSYSSHMTSKKCLIMNLKLGRNRSSSENNGTTSPAKQKKSCGVSEYAFPGHQLMTKSSPISPNTNDNNIMITPKQEYPSPSPPSSFLAPGPTGIPFHPFFMNPAAAAGLALPHPNPYTLSSLFNQLPGNLGLGALIKENGSPYNNNNKRPRSNSRSSPSRSRSPSPSADHLLWTANKKFKKEQDFEEEPTSPSSVIKNEEELDNKVRSLLTTVNANVTRAQLLQAVHFMANEDGDDSRDAEPSEESNNNNNNEDDKSKINLNLGLLQRKKNGGIEGLAARLQQELCQKKQELQDEKDNNDESGVDDGDDLHTSQSENESGDVRDNEAVEEGRRARVRSLFSESQLAILRNHYALDPRPRREHLMGLAQQLVLPLRVVQVWFQNSRARDRREGRPPNGKCPSLLPVSLYNNGFPSRLGAGIIGNWINASSNNSSNATDLEDENNMANKSGGEQPLDLTTKKSTPSNSPRPSLVNSEEMEESEGEEERDMGIPLNLKQGSPNSRSNSVTPTTLKFTMSEDALNLNGGSPKSRLAKILSQPPAPASPQFFANGPSNSSSPNGFGHSPLNLMSLSSSGENGLALLGNVVDHSIFNMQSSTTTPPNKKRKSSSKGHNSLTNGPSTNSSSGSQAGSMPDEHGQFACDQCEKSFNKQSSLARHKYEHSGQRPYKCDNANCGKAFKHKHHLTEHLRLHTGQKPFQCNKCGKRFSHSGSYSQHMNHRYAYCKPQGGRTVDGAKQQCELRL